MSLDRADGEPGTGDALQVSSVHDLLRDAILRGDIAAGVKMTQVALADQLHVGRTPLREAMRMLQREGLIVSELGRRVQIAPLTSEDAESLYVMRLCLEVVAIRLTVPTLSSQSLAELEGLLAQMAHFRRTDDARGLHVPHREFHMRLIAAAGPRGVATIGQLFDHAERYRLAYGGRAPEVWSDRDREHRELLDAVSERDAAAASVCLARHYAHTMTNVFAALDPGRDLGRVRTTLAVVAPGSETVLDGDASTPG